MVVIVNKNFVTLFILSFFVSLSARADFKDTLIPQNDIDQSNEQATIPDAQKISHHPKSTQQQSLKKQTATETSSSDNDFTKHNSKAPISFSGKTGDVSKKKGIITLEGDANLVQDDTTLTSNEVQIFLDSKPSTPSKASSLAGSSAISRAIALGNVHVHKKSSPSAPEITADSDSLEFLVKDRIMILTGNARVKKGQEFVNAKVMRINLNTGDISLDQPDGTLDPRSADSLNKKQEKTIAK